MVAIPRVLRIRVLVFVGLYLIAYLAASYSDLASTALGLQREGVSEKNVFATDEAGTYLPGTAWLLTLGGAGVMLACIVFAAWHARRVDEQWLRHPVRSFGKLYLNPFSAKGLGVAPLHTLSLALGFVLVRFIASANNLMVYWLGFGPMGALIKWVSSWTSPLASFCLVAFSFFIASIIAMSPLAAKVLRWWRET